MSPTHNTLMRLQRYFGFNEKALQANKAGRITARQRFRLTLSLSITLIMVLLFGGTLTAAGIIQLFNPPAQDDIPRSTFVYMLIFGIGLLVYGVQRGIRYYRDTTQAIQHITGHLSQSIETRVGSYAGGNYRPSSTQYYLLVTPESNHSSGKICRFSIDRDLHHYLREQRQQDRFRVYYLPETQTFLSAECVESS